MKKQLSTIERSEIQKKLFAGIKPSILAGQYNVCARTIKNIKFSDCLERKKYDSTLRSKVTAQDEINLSNLIEKGDNKLTASEMKTKLKIDVTPRTINRRIKKLGFETYVSRKRTKTTEDVEEKRLEYCLRKINEDWTKYAFVDESSININDNKSRTFFRSKKDCKRDPKNYREVEFKSIKLNLFGVLTYDDFLIFKIPSKFNSSNYYNLLKYGGIIEHLKSNYPSPIFYLHDHSPVHDEERAVNYINSNLNLVLDWPTYSPDLNIIEKAWNILKDRVRKRIINQQISVKNQNDLFELCQEESSNISKSTITSLYKGLPRKIKEVINLKGKRTLY